MQQLHSFSGEAFAAMAKNPSFFELYKKINL